ncbi:MAG: hypothetical protein JF888_03220 [Candidatus Dormibacteraeota bacterium]|uniref:Uncharacterized protein n=1 Tax=Candidatus Dormiibacter inghamiae TaxID=3127013 RepID=A0A934N678_9BACT|nr:hypothetical protein [Candidatus Dormibacteraeota bacterium]MBJ7607105.1 hypothetical protein [Candidatus Dormibacteraeota bacterium]
MDLASEAARLREAAQAKPLKLPVNRRIDERHRTVTEAGLTVWFTIQHAAHARIHEVLFERSDRPPADEEIRPWLAELLPGEAAVEAPGLPGAKVRRFEVFERVSSPGEARRAAEFDSVRIDADREGS